MTEAEAFADIALRNQYWAELTEVMVTVFDPLVGVLYDWERDGE